jgi:predicted enzyme related to lactoylglutathione lyase
MASTRLVDVAPILPVRNLRSALAHYESPGFRVQTYNDCEDYGFVSRNGVELHLTYQPTSYYPEGAFAVVYLQVEDADAVYRKWTKPGVRGQTTRPSPMPWGMQEGTHTDPDGNIIRFGTPNFNPDSYGSAAT